MASVEQVQGQIGTAKEQAGRAVQALQEAESQITEAQQSFQQAAQGSNQSEASDVNNAFAQVLQKIGETRDMVLRAISDAESYAGRL
jgi:uncharacterized protein YukE